MISSTFDRPGGGAEGAVLSAIVPRLLIVEFVAAFETALNPGVSTAEDRQRRMEPR